MSNNVDLKRLELSKERHGLSRQKQRAAASGLKPSFLSFSLTQTWSFSQFSLELCEDVGVGEIWEELLTTSKLLCSTYLKIKGICSLKALKFKHLKYTGENTDLVVSISWKASHVQYAYFLLSPIVSTRKTTTLPPLFSKLVYTHVTLNGQRTMPNILFLM